MLFLKLTLRKPLIMVYWVRRLLGLFLFFFILPLFILIMES